jgi:hypothetical protein
MARLRVLGESPPPPRENGENQLRELRDYLTRLKDELEFLLTHLGEDNFSESLATWVTDTGKSIADINTALDGKQDTLTFDDTPTSGSENPVKSGGVYTALQGKENADRLIVMNSDYVTLSTATWQSLFNGAINAIEMPITDRPTGYRPVSATLVRFENWPSGAHFIPSIGWSSGSVFVLSDTAQADVETCKLMVRVILEKES